MYLIFILKDNADIASLLWHFAQKQQAHRPDTTISSADRDVSGTSSFFTSINKTRLKKNYWHGQYSSFTNTAKASLHRKQTEVKSNKKPFLMPNKPFFAPKIHPKHYKNTCFLHKRRLVLHPNKPCLQAKQALFTYKSQL